MEVTGPQMVLTMKLTTFAWNVFDGRRKAEVRVLLCFSRLQLKASMYSGIGQVAVVEAYHQISESS